MSDVMDRIEALDREFHQRHTQYLATRKALMWEAAGVLHGDVIRLLNPRDKAGFALVIDVDRVWKGEQAWLLARKRTKTGWRTVPSTIMREWRPLEPGEEAPAP